MTFEQEAQERFADFKDVLKEIGFDSTKALTSGAEIFLKLNKGDTLPIVSIAPNACSSVDDLNFNLFMGFLELTGATSIFGKMKMKSFTVYKNNQLLLTGKIK